MDSRRGRRRKIEAEELSLFGEALEDIFKTGDILQKEVATAAGIAGSTLSQMKIGVRLTRNNIQRLLEGLVKMQFLTPDNFEQTANKLLELADEKPLNKIHKKDAELIGLLRKLPQNTVKKRTPNGSSFFNGQQIVITMPAIEFVMAYVGEGNYTVEKVLVKSNI